MRNFDDVNMIIRDTQEGHGFIYLYNSENGEGEYRAELFQNRIENPTDTDDEINEQLQYGNMYIADGDSWQEVIDEAFKFWIMPTLPVSTLTPVKTFESISQAVTALLETDELYILFKTKGEWYVI